LPDEGRADRGGLRQVIFTADDFGLDAAVNDAVEQAHRCGVLNCASLMVGEAAADDAVALARSLPNLRVGLHLTLVDGRPVSPPETIPDLVGQDGRFRDGMFSAGVRWFFLPHVRCQLGREIRAQFAAFAATGLELDHANAHKHFHLHPTVAALMIEIGREYGLRAIRVPTEPAAPINMAEGRRGGGLGAGLLRLWSEQLAWAVRRASMSANDHLFGLSWTGAMTEARLISLLAHLPAGVSEIYFHPASARTAKLEQSMPGYRHVEELSALTSPAIASVLAAAGIATTSFSKLAPR